MEWWRDARFGMFIHWGLYAIPAGEWNGNTTYAEWIRNQAEIPIDEYDKFVLQFNPVNFNADEWVRTAKDAGMKYIVITSKHHDGFCLFDSEFTDYDVMTTPFKRDILKELSEACKKQGIKLGFYYSIMDWHHPDYLPRRDWEDRSSEGADFERYIQYMKNQLKELLTNYGEVRVLWFDGEWENTWNAERGIDLYNYVRSLQPDIIVNNRVDPNRGGFEGFNPEGIIIGDFGTPEQQIPATGLPGIDWESCMTMNDHWGYNKNDKNWKSVKDIIQMLADIASKGGNYLLNVGPTAEGIFPTESVEILGEVGKWMDVYGESIYETSASPFKELEWGRCTQKNIGADTRLYLHVFDWPGNGKLVIPGIYSDPVSSYLLSDKTNFNVDRNEDALIISVPSTPADEINSIVVLDVDGKVDVSNPPIFESNEKIFIESLDVTIKSDRQNIDIRYTTDGSIPSIESSLYSTPVTLTETTTLAARCFREGKPVSGTAEETFTKVVPEPALEIDGLTNGIRYKYFEGTWEAIPDFNKLESLDEGVIENISLEQKKSSSFFGFEFTGFIKIPQDGIYTFYTASDDGSSLYIGDKLIVDNDDMHGIIEKSGIIALEEGYHSIKAEYFENAGGEDLKINFKGFEIKKQLLPAELLFYKK
jgi:alpha-L-fucosidase